MNYLKITFFILIISSIFIIGCSDEDTEWEEEVAVNSIELSQYSLRIRKGNSVTLEATAKDTEGNVLSDVEFAWESTKPYHASVDNGVISAVSVGIAKVRASAGAIESDYCVVQVYDFASITLNEYAISLLPDETFALNATAKDSDGEIVEEIEFGWETSDSSVVTVDENGNIIALSPGTAEITAYAEEITSQPCDIVVNANNFDLAWSGDHNSKVNEIAFSPSGDKVVSGGSDNAVKVWDVNSGALLWSGTHPSQVNHVAFSPDGSKIASGSGIGDTGAQIKVWNAETGDNLWSGNFMNAVQALEFSPDGNLIATGTNDRGMGLGQAYVQDAETGDIVLSRDSLNEVNSLSFSPDGIYLAGGIGNNMGEYSGIYLWEIETEELIWQKEKDGVVNHVEFSPDGMEIATAFQAKRLEILDAASGEIVWQTDVESAVKIARYTPQGDKIAIGTYRSLKLFNSATGELLWKNVHGDMINTIDFNSDGSQFASGSFDYFIKLWNIDGTLLGGTQHAAGVNSVELRSDGKIASGSSDATIKVWEYIAK
jgi:WD40 repeat protein